MCNKLTYNSYKEAQTIVNQAKKHIYTDGGTRKNRRKSKIPKRCYRYSDCGGWHLTSMSHYRDEGA